ncbi:DUF3006 domain-containing protein [Cytobacillus sp. FSL W7-1323]|uniref:DUF3006 domain-containing protein n=1 Tax=Cytobacillus sp. FSL W7-1323 TaxID=2921700 RepID=UPI003158CD4B
MNKAVLDRMVEGKAVLLVGDEQVEKIIAAHRLPPDATEGTWLLITMKEAEITEIIIDHDSTKAAKERIKQKQAKLLNRGSRFKQD